jgi:hypothetical protein
MLSLRSAYVPRKPVKLFFPNLPFLPSVTHMLKAGRTSAKNMSQSIETTEQEHLPDEANQPVQRWLSGLDVTLAHVLYMPILDYFRALAGPAATL